MPDYVGPYSPEYYDQPVADSYYMGDYHPWWYDLGIEAIRRGAETAQVVASGYPQIPSYPSYPTSPPPSPLPPQQSPSGGGIQLSTNTLIILGLVGFAFIFGKGRR